MSEIKGLCLCLNKAKLIRFFYILVLMYLSIGAVVGWYLLFYEVLLW